MSQLCDLKHKPFIFSYDKFLEDKLKNNKVYIFYFSELEMKIKKNMVPCFFYRGENEPYFKFIKTFNDNYITLFEDEFNNLKQFYEILNYKIDLVHCYLKGDKIYKPFVDYFYKIKQTTKNKTRKNLTKLILNSSYGKLGQKIRLPQIEQYLKGRVVTFRKKRDKNNFIIYEDILKNKMSVVNAAYITCSARCFIRNKILELSNGNMLKNFIYCDTDSIHTFNNYKNVNDELGGLKLEYSGQRGRYLKPKTYILEKDKKFKISAKGINKNQLINQLGENFEGFNYESYFYSLSSVLVKGGRALILINKNLGVRE